MTKQRSLWAYQETQDAMPDKGAKQGLAPAPKIFDVTDQKQLESAGPRDLVALKPLGTNPPMVVEKHVVELLAGGIVNAEFIHVHGYTGTGKTALIDAIAYEPENWRALCRLVGAPYLPLRIHPIEMAVFETVSELLFRRALRKGNTYDEPSPIVMALRKCLQDLGEVYPLLWFREMGRVPTASVQGGLLNLMTKGPACLSNDEVVCLDKIAYLADSNYHTGDTTTHVLVTQDDALNRRWTVSIPFDYLSPEQEEEITHFHIREGFLPKVPEELVEKVVRLGDRIRGQRADGSLSSLAPPSLYGYFSFLRCVHRHPHLSPRQVAEATMLGSASPKDREEALGLFSDVFGVGAKGSGASTDLGV